jgi:hypothetical protein
MNVNFAPGSWVSQGIEVVANYAGESVKVATVHGDHESNWNGSRKIAAIRANARLIASAPELFACLKQVLDSHGELDDALWNRIRNAVADASGDAA